MYTHAYIDVRVGEHAWCHAAAFPGAAHNVMLREPCPRADFSRWAPFRLAEAARWDAELFLSECGCHVHPRLHRHRGTLTKYHQTRAAFP
eukprot:2376757-Pyramimonas_sp.AAC.1